MKNIEHIIKVNCPLKSQYHQFNIGKDATFDLQELQNNHVLVKYLCQEHIKNGYSIVGNIGELYRIREDIFLKEKIGKMKYREYLEAKIRGEFDSH